MTAGNQRAAPILQEDEHHDHDEDDRLHQRLQHFANGVADKGRGVEGDGVTQARRKSLGKPCQLGANGLIDIESIGGGQLADPDADTVVAVEAKLAAVVLGAQLGMANVSQTDEGSVTTGLQNDVVELRDFGEPTQGAHADLIHLGGRGGLGSYLARGNLHILLLQSRDNIAGRKSACCQPGRIEPQAHGIFALAEYLHIGDARNTLQRVLDINVDVVADELVGVAIAVAVEAGRHDERCRHLVNDDAGIFDFVGQAAGHALHTILNVDGCQIERAGQFESNVDGTAAVITAGGSHVAHAFHAIDGFFQQSGYGGLDGLGVGAGVEGADRDLWWRQVRKLCHREEWNTHRTRDHDEQRGDGRENWTLDEEIGKQTVCPLVNLSVHFVDLFT